MNWGHKGLLRTTGYYHGKVGIATDKGSICCRGLSFLQSFLYPSNPWQYPAARVNVQLCVGVRVRSPYPSGDHTTLPIGEDGI